MHILKNEHAYDRFARLFLGVLLFEYTYFWLSGAAAIVVFLVSIVFLVTGMSGYCPVYQLIGFRGWSADAPRISKITLGVLGLLLVVLVIGGSYASVTITKRQFLESFNTVNDAYKQTLFATGQDDRDASMAHYAVLVSAYTDFSTKYQSYRPFVVRDDRQLGLDIVTLNEQINAVQSGIYEGDLHEAHLALEEVRPILQDILKRNGFSMLAVALVDFHDAMEAVLDPANEGNAAGVLAAYPDADRKLRAVETEANDEEVQVIRANLETLRASAEAGAADALPGEASALKSSFVKVYLARG